MIVAAVITACACFGIAIFTVGVLGLCAAAAREPLFCDDPADEFADDGPPICARVGCDYPAYRSHLCQGYYDVLIDMTLELRRDLEEGRLS